MAALPFNVMQDNLKSSWKAEMQPVLNHRTLDHAQGSWIASMPLLGVLRRL